MNKVYCNKETDFVEQIINIDVDTRWEENWFPNCYVVDDPDNEINTYNLRYNKETKEFEIVEGIPPKDEVIVEEAISNEDLKKENEILQNKITAMQATLDEIILNLI